MGPVLAMEMVFLHLRSGVVEEVVVVVVVVVVAVVGLQLYPRQGRGVVG